MLLAYAAGSDRLLLALQADADFIELFLRSAHLCLWSRQLLAAAGLVLLCVGLNDFLMYVRLADVGQRIARDLQKQASDKEQHDSKAPLSDFIARDLDRDFRERVQGTQLLHKSIWIVAGSVGALFLAALFTVLLVTTSRRATLHQINLSLMELSAQIRQLRSANPVEKIHRPENL